MTQIEDGKQMRGDSERDPRPPDLTPDTGAHPDADPSEISEFPIDADPPRL